MKIESGKYFAALPIFVLLVACAPMKPLTTSTQDIETRHAIQDSGSNLDHAGLAKQYDDLAKEMQAKVKAQKEAIKHKPRTCYFGKNGRNVKSHVNYKIYEYEQAAKESLEKAAYHRSMAVEQTNQKSTIKAKQFNKKESQERTKL